MTGNTGYTEFNNSDDADFAALLNSIYEHVDPLIDASVATVAALPASGNFVGRTRFEEEFGTVRVWDGSAWKRKGNGKWISYTPTLTNLSLGTGGTLFAEYRYEGDLVRVRFKFIMGTSPIVGTAIFSLPVASAALSMPYEIRSGNSSYFDTSAGGIYVGHVMANVSSTSTVMLRHTSGSATAVLGPSGPLAWDSGDAMVGEFTYRV